MSGRVLSKASENAKKDSPRPLFGSALQPSLQGPRDPRGSILPLQNLRASELRDHFRIEKCHGRELFIRLQLPAAIVAENGAVAAGPYMLLMETVCSLALQYKLALAIKMNLTSSAMNSFTNDAI